MEKTIKTDALITCPACGAAQKVEMPVDT